MKYTYFIKGGDFVKIGQTRNLKGRISALQVSNPFKLSVIRTTIQINEKDAHRQAAKLTQRKASEWFGITPELMEWINSLEHAEPLEVPAKRITKTQLVSISAPIKKKPFVTIDLEQLVPPDALSQLVKMAQQRGCTAGELAKEFVLNKARLIIAASRQVEVKP